MAENENIEEMMSPENENNREWYYRTFLEFERERESIKNKYFNHLNEVKTDVPFFFLFLFFFLLRNFQTLLIPNIMQNSLIKKIRNFFNLNREN